MPNKKKLRNDKIENTSKTKQRNRNQRNRELRASRTQIENLENDSSSIIKVPKIFKTKKLESNSIDDKTQTSSKLNKINNTSTIKSKKIEDDMTSNNYSMIHDNNNSIINENNLKEKTNKKYEEFENKYEVLLQSYKTLKEENTILIQENKSLQNNNSRYSEENTFLNNYIISIKKIVITIINSYSKEIQRLSQIIKNHTTNTKTENKNFLFKIKNVVDKYSSQELERNKRINLIIMQLIQENKILRKILMSQKPDKNYLLQDNQELIVKDHKLNFNYDFLKNFNKIDNDFEKKLYLNISFNNNVNKTNSVKKKNKKEIHYGTDKNYINENNFEENNRNFERKTIKYSKIKKK